MAFAAADYGVAYSRRTTIELREKAGLLALVNMAHEAEVLGDSGHKTVVQDIDYGTATDVSESSTTSAFNADWGTPGQIGATQIQFAVNRELRQQTRIREYDADGVPFAAGERIRESQRNKMRVKISHGIAEYFAGLTTRGTLTAASADKPKEDGTGDNGNAGKIYTFGTIGGSSAGGLGGDQSAKGYGDFQGADTAQTAQGKAIKLMVENFRDYAEQIFIANGDEIGDSPGALWAVAHFKVWRALARHFESEKFEFDRVNESVITPETPAIFRPGSMMFGGRYNGVNLVASLAPSFQPAQTDATSKAAGFPVFMGTNAAVTAAIDRVRSQILTPETNQTSPQHYFRQWCYWGRQIINAPLLTHAKVKSIDQ